MTNTRTKTNYFEDCTTAEELKKEYRKLAQQYHPDLNEEDTTEIMQAINNEYEVMFEQLKNIHTRVDDNGEETTYTAKTSTTETAGEFINIISELVRCKGVIVELVGRWIWCSGNTFAYKEVFKTLNFTWSKSKKAWYWHKEGESSFNHKPWSLDKIRNAYGSTRFIADEKEPAPALN